MKTTVLITREIPGVTDEDAAKRAASELVTDARALVPSGRQQGPVSHTLTSDGATVVVKLAVNDPKPEAVLVEPAVLPKREG